MKVTLIGDTHGWYSEVYKKLSPDQTTIQLGDLCLGNRINPALERIFSKSTKNYFVRGNHDNPKTAKYSSQFLQSGRVSWAPGTFIVNGAWSIDKPYRPEWFRDEEHNLLELGRLVKAYKREKPKVVISHTCPLFVAEPMFGIKQNFVNSTSLALQAMFNYHQPERWYFGHWHQSVTQVIDGCKFQCLDITECQEVEL